MTEVVKYLLAHKAVFAPMFIGLAFSAMNLYGVIAWSPTFFPAHLWLDATACRSLLGVVNLIAAPLGLVVGTWLNGRFAKQGRDDTNLRVLLLAQAVRVPAAILSPLMPNPFLALFFSGVVNFSAMVGAPSQNAALQIITPNEMRGQVTALYLFMFSVIGSGLRPEQRRGDHRLCAAFGKPDRLRARHLFGRAGAALGGHRVDGRPALRPHHRAVAGGGGIIGS